MNHNQLLTCANCGEPITAYGPETFHTNTTLIRCANAEGTRATRKEAA